MKKSLLIVESPAKARTIGKYLGGDLEVKASVGHIRDLPVNRLGVDVEGGFVPEYVTIRGKQKVVNQLKKAAQGKKVIYLGPDPDREGEAIAWHIAAALEGENRVFKRVLFHELTPAAIREAMAQPEELSQTRFESQQARRILDRLVGYRLSPLLWTKVKRGLSAGRVQSVALRLIIEREREIFAFEPQEYWSLTARLKAEGEEFAARLFKEDGQKVELKTGAEAREIMAAVQGRPFVVGEVTSKERKRQPAPPFTTSQLQQEAFKRLQFPPAKTMALAQQLYEGVDLGPAGTVGLITYMRTDSVRVSSAALNQVRQVIRDQFGKDYLPDRPRQYRNKKGAQDAHEAIRPASAARTPEKVKAHLSRDLLALYDLVWRRFTASQMKPALFDQTAAEIQAGKYLWRATGSVLKFSGFLEVYSRAGQEEGEVLPPLQAGQRVDLVELIPRQHFTQPPPRFNEGTLVKELEDKGIGRPSTYATIISTLRDKEYVTSQKGQLAPTELGFLVNDLLVANFPHIMDVGFTAGMEDQLDEIEEGQTDWHEVLARFYQPFDQDLARADKEMLSLKREGLKTEVKCEACGADMVLKWGRHGPFLSCRRYPECRNAQNYQRDDKGRLVPVKEETKATEETCEKCGRPMVQKNGRFGPFLACSGYPECKNTRPLGREKGPAEELALPQGMDPKCDKCGAPLAVKRNRRGGLFIACTNYPKCKNTKPYPTGVKCPRAGCDGELAERRSKGRTFYGCSNYPKCRFTMRARPVNQACPQCGAPYLVEPPGQPGTLHCPDKNCGYKTGE